MTPGVVYGTGGMRKNMITAPKWAEHYMRTFMLDSAFPPECWGDLWCTFVRGRIRTWSLSRGGAIPKVCNTKMFCTGIAYPGLFIRRSALSGRLYSFKIDNNSINEG